MNHGGKMVNVSNKKEQNNEANHSESEKKLFSLE